jgi:hypothetical protein
VVAVGVGAETACQGRGSGVPGASMTTRRPSASPGRTRLPGHQRRAEPGPYRLPGHQRRAEPGPYRLPGHQRRAEPGGRARDDRAVGTEDEGGGEAVSSSPPSSPPAS